MKLSDLFTDNKAGRLSSNKLWFNIGNFCFCIVFLKLGLFGEVTADILAVFGVVVCGSGAAAKFISKKYSDGSNIDADTFDDGEILEDTGRNNCNRKRIRTRMGTERED